jgi:predicted AlkP superfamily pyrophosphatase or phosphodiesterase
VRRLSFVLIALAAACAPRGTGPVAERDRGGTPAGDDGTHVVLISFDGMRYDMPGRTATPAFDRVAGAGVRATGLIPSYPTKTFPNHYTLATGLYPAHHGLVDNAFYDRDLDATYRLGDSTAVRDGRWYGGEPIWVTAETQGVRTASYFWVGTEAEIQGVRPTYFKYYDETVPDTARVDTVLHWLSLPAPERPRLVLLYFSEPDHTAHRQGPDAAAVDSVVRTLDGVLGRLLDGLDALPIADRTHVVLVSDHGMADAPADQVIYLDDHANLDGVRVVSNATQTLLYFDGDTARVRSVHQALEGGLEHATTYLAGETPDRWHYEPGPRIGDLIVAADPGWTLRLRDWRPWRGGGTHGWDPYHRAMHGIFMAAGPRIRPGPDLAAFENVHVYPLVARLLGLRPAEGIDGSLAPIEPVLREATAP